MQHERSFDNDGCNSIGKTLPHVPVHNNSVSKAATKSFVGLLAFFEAFSYEMHQHVSHYCWQATYNI